MFINVSWINVRTVPMGAEEWGCGEGVNVENRGHINDL